MIDLVSQNVTTAQRLANGLRINGQAPSSESETAAPASTEIQPENAQETEASEAAVQTKKDVKARFTDTLMGRLVNDKSTFTSLEEAQGLLDSILSTVDEIKNQFGDGAANQVMADILTNTEQQVSAERIGRAVGGALQRLYYANKSVMENGGATEEELAHAKETKKKLEGLLEFLNGKKKETVEVSDKAAEASGESAQKSLASVVNDYFGLEGDDRRVFTVDFSWKTEASIKAANRCDQDYFTITMDEFGQANKAQLVDFLRNYLEDEGAAKIIEDLGGGDDIFEAVEKVRDYFFTQTTLTKTPGPNNPLGLTQREGPGLEKLAKFNTYIDKYMNMQINQVVANNSLVKDRMMEYAGDYFASQGQSVPENFTVSFSSFFMPNPVPRLGDYNDTYRGRNGQPVVQFGQRQDIASLEDYKRHEIEMVKGWADFNRVLLENPGNLKINSHAEDELMKQYEEMKDAFENGTSSSHKTMSEEMLDGYQYAEKKTPSGSLVDTTA